MPKAWRLTRQAEVSVAEIARWTFETFGPRQAAAYEEDLIARCVEIASGTALSRPCGHLADVSETEDLRYAHIGEHYVIFVEDEERVVIIDFLHARSDLPRRLAGLDRSW